MDEHTIKASENVAWKSDEPTWVVRNAFSEGLIRQGDKVVDIGSGFGRNANWLAKMGAEVIGVNINDDEIRQAKTKAHEANLNVNYIRANATRLPFPQDSFEVALDLGCSHMISSREGQEKAAREVARVLKSGGHLIFFGFSKDHPSFTENSNNPMFRNIEDIESLYSPDFEIVSQEEVRWKPKPEENSKVKEHVGINVIMKRK